MEIDKALSIIYSSYNKFSSLPESMSDIINKSRFQSYLQQNNSIDSKAIELFLNLIFDENEEDQNNIPREAFDSKYEALLKLLDDDEDDNDFEELHQEKEIKEEGHDKNKGETPTKGNRIVNFCSPILIRDSTNKNENDTSIEAVELFKDITFEKEKHSNDDNPHLRHNHHPDSYNSIIRPSNNFNFNTSNEFNKQSTQSPREKHVPLLDNNNFKQITMPKLRMDFNLKHYKKKKNMKFINYNSAVNSNYTNTHYKSSAIQQKIQDVYFQIHKSKDIGIQISTTPIKRNVLKKHYSNSNNNKPVSGGFNTNFNFNKNEDYFSNIYKSINNNPMTMTIPSGKTMNTKMSYFYRKEKRNGLFQNYSLSHNKLTINQKFEGLNKILNSKSLGPNEQKMLNADDFITLEDKMSQFSQMKKGASQSRSILKRECLMDDYNSKKRAMNGNGNSNDIDINKEDPDGIKQ